MEALEWDERSVNPKNTKTKEGIPPQQKGEPIACSPNLSEKFLEACVLHQTKDDAGRLAFPLCPLTNCTLYFISQLIPRVGVVLPEIPDG